MRSAEWSLISFTLLMQAAVGAFVVFTFLNHLGIGKINIPFPRETTLKLLLFVLGISIFALAGSFLHLGKPQNAIYALSNLGSSWLSREIFFVMLFFGLTAVYTFLEYRFENISNLKMILAIAVCLTGVLAVFSMAKVYMIATVPVWNSFSTLFQFYSSAGVLGITIYLLLTLFINNSSESLAVDINPLFKILLPIISLSLIFFVIKIWILSGGSTTEIESYRLLLSSNLVLVIVRILFSVLAITFLTILIISPHKFSSTVFLLLCLAIVMNEIFDRYLFYASYTRIGV